MTRKKQPNRPPTSVSLHPRTTQDLKELSERLNLSRGQVIDLVVEQWLEDRQTVARSPCQQEAVQKPLATTNYSVQRKIDQVMESKPVLDRLDDISFRLKHIELQVRFNSHRVGNLPCSYKNMQ